MKLSTRGKYGLYAMYYLAAHKDDGPQSLQNIATIGVPRQYLEQLLGNLRRLGSSAACAARRAVTISPGRLRRSPCWT
jgi:hypothetical protein